MGCLAEPYGKDKQIGLRNRAWRKRKAAKEWRTAKKQVRLRAEGRCEASAAIGCEGTGSCFHHRKLRSHGGSNTADNGLLVCVPCHDYIHAHPSLSYSRGWMVRGV